MTNPIRVALGVLLAAMILGPAWSQGQNAPPAKQATPPATQAEQPAQAASDSKPVPAMVGGAFQQATLIHMVQPVYPKEAKEAGISGTVVVKGTIARDGSLQQVEYVSGPEELRQAAIDAVTQWRYSPATLAGKPVEVDTSINVVFALKKTDEGAPRAAPLGTPGDSSAAASQRGVDASNGKGPLTPLLPTGIAPAPIRVGGNVQASNLVHRVNAVYPEEAKRAHVSGTVVLHVIIARDGTVETVDIISGPKELVGAAVDAVKQWRYEPTLLNGRPVEVETTIQVGFSMP